MQYLRNVDHTLTVRAQVSHHCLNRPSLRLVVVLFQVFLLHPIGILASSTFLGRLPLSSQTHCKDPSSRQRKLCPFPYTGLQMIYAISDFGQSVSRQAVLLLAPRFDDSPL
eukprot:TRINITY_DN55259_c0_g1_i1.p1 TRINITY_DN55259_c0_g1~~TRINITY_DN55259_c0_g1_i1.p1  ORF type:complete len:111 (-),score=7.05 TRINITY_DN55259_c0_g1_i1:14-346(-)